MTENDVSRVRYEAKHEDDERVPCPDCGREVLVREVPPTLTGPGYLVIVCVCGWEMGS